jgi:16S rRNA (adenine1518-N6/adenine1519-N6)-dimethyltransferase
LKVRPKKHLGQHFLTNEPTAKKIADACVLKGASNPFLEIGPGTGALTKHLLEIQEMDLYVCEIDQESIDYLAYYYPELNSRIFKEDFLKMDLDAAKDKLTAAFSLVGNFPYNISSQILFKAYDHKDQIIQVAGMFQKEVAQRVCEKPGSKAYGILSVLLQIFFDVEYLHTVPPGAFYPPPKVDSAIFRIVRNDVTDEQIGCDSQILKKVVKAAFGQRRKTLRNSLKSLFDSSKLPEHFISKRPEQLEPNEFIEVTKSLI